MNQKVNGFPLVYLDNAASTQHPTCVIDDVARYYREDHANVHRGIHALSTRATKLYEDARARAARFLGAASAESIIFTRGTTEGINLVASSWGTAHLGPGDIILITEMEHHANLIPWQVAARRTGASLQYLPVTGDEGTIDWSQLERKLQTDPIRLMAFTHISNSLGCINPVRDICATARRHGTVSLVDAAQSAGHAPINVQELDCDFLVFSGHKCCGPTGIGVLYGNPKLLTDMQPYQFGGEMISRVTYESADAKPGPASDGSRQFLLLQHRERDRTTCRSTAGGNSILWSLMEIDELYQTIILDHSKRPRNFGELPPPAAKGEGYNPSCGDEVVVFVNRSPLGAIEHIRFTGQACAISMASTSLMPTQVTGKTVAEPLGLKRTFIDFLTRDAAPAAGLGNLQALGGVKKFPQRLKCATLGWHALEGALKNCAD